MSDSITRQSNDSTMNQLGNIYQYHIALLDCFGMSEGDTILIELEGDVTLTSKTGRVFQKEVKHHIADEFLTERDVDLWKTLKNWMENYDSSMKFKKLILFTTAKILDNSQLYMWNNKSKEDKYSVLHSFGDEIKEKEKSFRQFYNVFFDLNKRTVNDIENLLDKFEIVFNQNKIDGIASCFGQFILTIPDVNKDFYISALLGQLFTKVKYFPYKWTMTCAEFHNHIQQLAKSYVGSEKADLPIEFISAEISDEILAAADEKIFVKELLRINYEKMIPRAKGDYWKAKYTIMRYFSDNILLVDDLKDYRDNLEDKMFYSKESIVNSLSRPRRSRQLQESRLLCSNVLGWDPKNFGNIVANKPFFQKGVIHMIVDEDKFKWDIGKKNEY